MLLRVRTTAITIPANIHFGTELGLANRHICTFSLIFRQLLAFRCWGFRMVMILIELNFYRKNVYLFFKHFIFWIPAHYCCFLLNFCYFFEAECFVLLFCYWVVLLSIWYCCQPESSEEYVISLKAFNKAGHGKPIYETTRTRDERG